MKRSIQETFLKSGRGWRLVRRMTARMTALDVDGSMLRVVQTVRRQGQTRVAFFATCRLEFAKGESSHEPAAQGRAIQQALRQMKIRPGWVVMGLPRAMAVLRTLQVPATDNLQEMAAMIQFQVARDLPFAVEEAVIDFKIQGPAAMAASKTPSAEPGEKKDPGAPAVPKVAVLVAAAKKEDLEKYRLMARAAGIRLAALGLRSYAHARCVQACNLIRPEESVALISLRPDEVIIDVLRDQFLAFSRVAPVGQPHEDDGTEDAELRVRASAKRKVATEEPEKGAAPGASSGQEEGSGAGEAERFSGAVTIEVVRSLHSYESTSGSRSVRQVVVAGATGHEGNVVEALGQRLSIPCNLLDPSGALGLPESQRQQAPGALAAFGLGLGIHDPRGLPFDFLHPKRPALPPMSKRTKGLALAAVGCLVLILGLAGVHRMKQTRLQEQQQVLALLAQEKERRPIYQRTRLQERNVRNWVRSDISWLDYLSHLSTNLPSREEIYLNSISTSSRDTIRLSVQARSGEVLAKLDRQLREAGYELKPLAINPSPDRHGYGFKSNVEAALPELASGGKEANAGGAQEGISTP